KDERIVTLSPPRPLTRSPYEGRYALILRIIFVLGMGLHKLVWELLRRRDGALVKAQPQDVPLTTRLVKLFKMAVLAGIVLQTLLLPDFPAILAEPSSLRIVGTVIYFVGLGTAVLGRFQLGDNWANLEDYQVLAKQQLVTRGIYGWVRHPIYAGDILLLLGLELALNSWLVLGIVPLTAVVLHQARAEEKVLAQSFPGYETYQQKTKMLIPFVL
ncbi:MAG: methyltransferase family protein, partial [Anaerolineae bacterium]